MVIDKENENVRLDRFLKKNCKNNTLSEIFKAIRLGYVKINGKSKKENYRLKLNDIIEIQNLDFKLTEKKIKNIKENKKIIFFENDDYLIINKPKNIPMHKGTKNQIGLSEMFNISFANRLDKKTGGLVIGCKNNKSLRHITELIRERKIEKKYIAITKNNGKLKEGDVFTLKNNLKITENKVVISKDGLYCESEFKVVKISDKTIKFEVKLLTGRKHQIRVQLANIGLPIIGDDKYGNYNKNDELQLVCKYISFENYVFEI